MKISKIFSGSTYSIDKHNLRYLLSNIPTQQFGNPLTTRLSTTKGSFTDLRAIGGKSIIEIGKSKLEIDHLNGKILSYKKPFFKSLKKLVNQASELLTFISDNIKNPKAVKKSTLETLTFSEKEAEDLLKLNKNN